MASKDNSGESAIRVIVFSGKIKDWLVWSEKFMARAVQKGYNGILTGTDPLPDSADVSANAKTTRGLNQAAYSDLILSMADTDNGNVAFNIVRNAKNDDYKNGNAYLAWKNLKKKYEPNTAPTEMSLYRQLYQSKLEDKQDPDVWISRLEDLRFRLEAMGTKIEDRTFLMHIMNNVTHEYATTIQMIEKRNHKDVDEEDRLTLEILRADLSLQFERLYGNNTGRNDDDEYALFAGGKFKGYCRKCGKQGHKQANCRYNKNNHQNNNGKENGNNNGNGPKYNNNNGNGNRPNNNRNNGNGARFNGECNYCKKTGHRWIECRKRLWDNKNKQQDQANTTKEENASKVELSLIAFEEDLCLITTEDSEETRIPQQPEGIYVAFTPQIEIDEYDMLTSEGSGNSPHTYATQECMIGEDGYQRSPKRKSKKKQAQKLLDMDDEKKLKPKQAKTLLDNDNNS